MSAAGTREREWHLVEGQQHLGVFSTSALSRMAREGKIPPAAQLSCGEGWISVEQFLERHPPSSNGSGTTANGSGQGAATAPQPWMQPAPAAVAPAVPSSYPQAAPPMAMPPPSMPAFTMPPMAPPMAMPPMGAPMAAPHFAPRAMSAQPQYFEAPPAAPDPVPEPAPAAPMPMAPMDEGPPERDRIVVLGRRQSGKTIYLASVYQKLWRNLHGLSAKALRGDVHRQLSEVSHELKQGRWPAATLGSSQMELELEEGGQKRLMVALDYAGEMFANAFVHERMDLPDVKALVDHIDRAAAVMLLIDPSIVAGMDHQAAMEDDFGLVQAVQRIRNWPGGDLVPIVLVLTKIDQHQKLLDQFGGPDGFCRHHFPALVRLLKKVAIFQVSAVQIEKGQDGKPVPRKDSSPMNVDNPLRYCLRQVLRAHERTTTDRTIQEQRMLEARLRREEEEREKKQNFILILTVSAIILVGVIIILLIVL